MITPTHRTTGWSGLEFEWGRLPLSHLLAPLGLPPPRRDPAAGLFRQHLPSLTERSLYGLAIDSRANQTGLDPGTHATPNPLTWQDHSDADLLTPWTGSLECSRNEIA